MSKEQIIGNIVVIACCWGIGALALIIGIIADRVKKPISSWTGSKRHTENVWDVRGFNREVGKIWKYFSIPFWVAGPLWIIHAKLGAVVMLLGIVIGIPVVGWFYRRIAKKYTVEDDSVE